TSRKKTPRSPFRSTCAASTTVPSRIATGDSGLRSERADSRLAVKMTALALVLALAGAVLGLVRRRQAAR
ncbi:MAG: hypothetical protein QOG49_54, partial [Frankiaceae bacterium]|nr:hypothetical protein [Frankiaceae bacterium]